MISKIIAEDLVSRAREAIAVKEDIVITCHVGPDGDALGSSLALWHYLRGLGKRATVVVPNRFPDFLAWMPGAEDIIVFERDAARAEEAFAGADLVFVFMSWGTEFSTQPNELQYEIADYIYSSDRYVDKFNLTEVTKDYIEEFRCPENLHEEDFFNNIFGMGQYWWGLDWTPYLSSRICFFVS